MTLCGSGLAGRDSIGLGNVANHTGSHGKNHT
jgi:hypothetical protein